MLEEDPAILFSTDDPDQLQGGTYIVKSGDSLSVIAQKNGCTVAQLQSLNNIANANLIQIGQSIRLCDSGSGSSSKTPVTGSLSISEAGYAIVKSPVYGNVLGSSQKSGIQTILNGCNTYKVNIQQCAYVLATVAWETARTMKPVKEGLNASDSWRANLRYAPYWGRYVDQI